MSAVETDTHVLQRNQVDTSDRDFKEPEKEVPVKSGSKVKVTKVTGPLADKKTGAFYGTRNADPEDEATFWKPQRAPRKRTYKKPKDMTA